MLEQAYNAQAGVVMWRMMDNTFKAIPTDTLFFAYQAIRKIVSEFETASLKFKDDVANAKTVTELLELSLNNTSVQDMLNTYGQYQGHIHQSARERAEEAKKVIYLEKFYSGVTDIPSEGLTDEEKCAASDTYTLPLIGKANSVDTSKNDNDEQNNLEDLMVKIKADPIVYKEYDSEGNFVRNVRASEVEEHTKEKQKQAEEVVNHLQAYVNELTEKADSIVKGETETKSPNNSADSITLSSDGSSKSTITFGN